MMGGVAGPIDWPPLCLSHGVSLMGGTEKMTGKCLKMLVLALDHFVPYEH